MDKIKERNSTLSSQPSRHILKLCGPPELEADNIYMVGPDRYK